MFDLNEKIVYPGHGVAKINRIIEKKVGSCIAKFFELTFINKDMTILVPVDNVDSVGIRKLYTKERINNLFEMLTKPAIKIPSDPTLTNWNKRNKEYQGKIRSGDLCEICSIYRDLKRIEGSKELSFGEKALLYQTEALLVEEIALVKNVGEDKATQELRKVATQKIKSSGVVKSL